MKLLYLHTGILEEKEIFEKSMSFISEDRKGKIKNYKNEQTARLSLGAGMLLRIAMDQEELFNRDIQYGKHGKPYLPLGEFHFSLSHSGKYVVCVCGKQPVGVDLQKIKDDIPKHTGKILSQEERRYLESLHGKDRVKAFYQIWADKESIIKWDGRGLRIPLTEISLTDDEKAVSEIIFEGEHLFLKRLDLFSLDYALSICSSKEIHLSEIKEIDANFLTKY